MKVSVKYLYSAFWLLVALSFATMFMGQGNSRIAVASCLIVIALLYRTTRLFGLVSAPMAYATLFTFFHFATVFSVYVLGLPVPAITNQFLESNELSTAIILSTFGLIGFVAGTECGRKPQRMETASPEYTYNREYRAIFVLAFIGLLISLGVYIVAGLYSDILIGGKQLLAELRRAGALKATIFELFSSLFTVFSFVALAYAPRRCLLWIAAIPVTVYMMPFLSGRRGMFIVTVAALALVLHRRGIRIPKSVAVIAIPAGMWTASILRGLTKVGAQPFASEWYLNAAHEMGRQLRIVVFTIEEIRHNVTDFWWGASYLWGLWRVVPNIGGVRSLFEPANPGQWITDLKGNYSGLGFSSVAEAFLNFGWPGTFLIMGTIGFFLARFEYTSIRSPQALAIYGATLGGLFFAVRGDFSNVIRPLCWTAFTVWILHWIVSVVATKRSTLSPRYRSDQP